MIIPYGHEKSTVRRLPWVTFTLIGLCVLVFIATNLAVREDGQERAVTRMLDVLQYLSSHPYLEVDARFEQFLRERLSEEELEQLHVRLEAIKHFGMSPPDSARAVREEQEELVRRVDLLLAAVADMRDNPFFRWGLVPASFKLHALVSYQFLHGGFWHLLFNMLFLFLAAPFIEDVWGRPLFAAFYLVAGTVSGLMYAVHYPDLAYPLIGASGAVAGVMGAFLVRCWNARIRFLYYFGPVRPLFGTFSSPAWVMLPLWFLLELFNAQAKDVAFPGSGGGVAHWAHVWGFAFGLAVAGAMLYYKVEERFIHPAIEAKITLVENTAVEEAVQARTEGRVEEAASRLRAELRAHPDNLDAVMAWWSMAIAGGAAAEVVPHYLRAARRSLQRDDPSLVLGHWHELLQAAPALELDPQLGARVAELLHDHGDDDGVATTLAAAARGLRTGTPAAVLARLARLAAATGHQGRAALLEAALAAPDLPPEVREELVELAGSDRGVTEQPPAPEAAAEPEAPIASPAPPPRTLQAMDVVPRALEGDVLTIEVRGDTRQLDLTQVQAVAVAGVRRPGERPLLVVDLLLDPPWGERETLRSLRLLSTGFDPRRVVGGDEALAAFRNLIGRLLALSGAVPLPDPDAARGEPFRTFASLGEYQRETLGIEVEGPDAG